MLKTIDDLKRDLVEGTKIRLVCAYPMTAHWRKLIGSKGELRKVIRLEDEILVMRKYNNDIVRLNFDTIKDVIYKDNRFIVIINSQKRTADWIMYEIQK